AKLAADPRLLAYFPIHPDTTTKRRIPDTSAADNHATLVRTDRVPDRWGRPGAALDFTPTGSRARLTVPGTHSALTLACWIKIDSLDRWYNSLFLTDGHELNEPHWQIMDDGRLFFSVKKYATATADHSDKHIFYSPSFWSPDLSGKWLHIATVYDTAAKTVTHYLNGEPLSIERIPEKYLVDTIQIGPASIGNWSEPKRDAPHFAVRNLNGSIDEFALFDTALDRTEITGLYKAGKP
ncbi:MAG: LamG domain-containing protein, partial [Verrucomicrobiales bacterium]|nr:LamG domain-containing protein [Verrucomicrobiales bacterium]